MSSSPTQLVIFGITGDLARKKLLPALASLARDRLLPEPFEIIGVTRQHLAAADLPTDLSIRLVTLDMTNRSDYARLKTTLDDLEDEHGVCMNRLFYLSIPPHAYGPVVDLLGEAGLAAGCHHGTGQSRLMVEKPFGFDLATAQELIARLKRSFTEAQIYRIDHYLAKETAQNILTFRFTNPIFKAVWNRQSVEHITITASESIGIEGRAAFYEPVGALRDLIQSHLMQLLALVTMEEPPDLTAQQIHREKLKLLKSITPIKPSDVATRATRGQYQGYREEVASSDSITETFARLELEINTDRWQGVPITLQTGKHLDRKTTEITLAFGGRDQTPSNTLTFRLQPGEGIAIDLLAKKPGLDYQTERVEMAFNYHDAPGAALHPDAYQRVLADGIRGDQTLFATSDEVLASWTVIEAVIAQWAKDGDSLITYKPGAAPDEIA